MPNDFLTLNALASELNEILCPGKIEKIAQPERDEILLTVRNRAGKHNLVISCYAETPRIHLTNVKKENPLQAPAFLMHLRKLIGQGIVESAVTVGNDRIIALDISSKSEMKDVCNYRLIFEMMGRYSNILICDSRGIILDAVKQVSFDQATKRVILPGMPYEPPEQTKLDPYDYAGLEAALQDYKGGGIAKFLIRTTSGLSPVSAEEIVRKSGANEKDFPNNTDIRRIIEAYRDMYDYSALKPNVCLNDYFIKPYDSAEGEKIYYRTISEAIEAVVNRKDAAERHRLHTKHLTGAVKKYRLRNEKQLQKAYEKLEECSKIDTYLQYGDIISCNLYRIQKGLSKVTLPDYNNNSSEVTVPLDPLLTPNENAQAYYRKYRKLKRQKEFVTARLDEIKDSIEYADALLASIATSDTAPDVRQIEEELTASGIIRNKQIKTTKSSKPEPYFYEYEDFAILVGKNNYQNDNLTFKIANGGDIWLHTLGYHGSHVIIMRENREVPDSVILFSAELAAYYSTCKGEKVTVDYTERRNVRRSPSGKPGLVTYSSQRSLTVMPDAHTEYLKK